MKNQRRPAEGGRDATRRRHAKQGPDVCQPKVWRHLFAIPTLSEVEKVQGRPNKNENKTQTNPEKVEERRRRRRRRRRRWRKKEKVLPANARSKFGTVQ